MIISRYECDVGGGGRTTVWLAILGRRVDAVDGTVFQVWLAGLLARWLAGLSVCQLDSFLCGRVWLSRALNPLIATRSVRTSFVPSFCLLTCPLLHACPVFCPDCFCAIYRPIHRLRRVPPPFALQVMGEHGMLSLGNPPSSGLEIYNSTGCTASPPEYSFPQRFREVHIICTGSNMNE